MIRVLTYGTFDLFHVGHIRLLKRLKELGTELYVGVSSDEFNQKKGKNSFFSYEERSEIVGACKYVDFVFKEDCWEQKRGDIEFYGADIFAIGDDWKGEFDFLNDTCKVVYLPRTDDISTTKIKETLSSISKSELEKIEKSLHDIIGIVKTISAN
ncbi:TPA: adenylyltransferase/cytidyltransferase family protein [Vibrio parahaemolyticus]|uniref:Adenylyltransferase/cytidyltransferase family protein n=1 Tax=Vibrio campbellii TaxID=680 RepID=A0ABY5IGR3_9VIBR|nr:adenylyltransferase/cytidyltransferase family protein [Vibrio alginolyticus]EGQ9595717.1 adenylyltransferase/cytidyltransferase family protein [Vibrio parahaemolyticus]UTZ20575.1 adenylyltransferase/cytidyltransferase family protein [Vibrio campbellii]EHK9125927.1 adenylyltransferase/cytidyltransferase family protein [Vibrio parahaemolyticus]EHU4888629.1 adenylyltransferase/cytidyltransferase family protein [Vibrio parahaemolyticus]EHU5132668.1 adenylyltransferase/cytidyltransferase family 